MDVDVDVWHAFNSLKLSDAFICIGKLGHHHFRLWLVASSSPMCYLNQHWIIVNSLVPGRFQRNFQMSNFPANFGHWWLRQLLWMSLYLIDDKSKLVQVMAWCRQATSHYLSQCWPRSLRHMVSLGHNELIGPLRTYFIETGMKIQWFSCTKINFKMPSAKWQPSYLSLDVLNG